MKQHTKTDSSEINLVSLSVRVPKDMADKLKIIADRADRAVAAEIRRVLRDHVEDGADVDEEQAA